MISVLLKKDQLGNNYNFGVVRLHRKSNQRANARLIDFLFICIAKI